jgi:cytochrome c
VAVVLAAGATETGAGARAFQKCFACHSLDPRETNLPGPNLHKLFGRVAGTLPGFEYSEAMVTAGRRMGLVWDEHSLDQYLADPEYLVPGTLMALVSIKEPEERKVLIEYLKHAAE